jgi:hypothetical protein
MMRYDYHTNIAECRFGGGVPTVELQAPGMALSSGQIGIGQKADDLARFDLRNRFAELYQPIGFDQR